MTFPFSSHYRHFRFYATFTSKLLYRFCCEFNRAVYAMMMWLTVCPSVCLSQVDVFLRLLHLGSRHRQEILFTGDKGPGEIPTG